MYSLESRITIGKFTFSGVHDVVISRSVHSLSDTAVIQLPTVARISDWQGRKTETAVTATKFRVGDKVTIGLGYNATYTEFTGYVTAMDPGRPLKVHCEGIGYPLKLAKMYVNEPRIKLSDLVKRALNAAGLQMRTIFEVDMYLYKVTHKGTAYSLLDRLLNEFTDGNLTMFCPEENNLWCGLLYSPYADGKTYVFRSRDVQYRQDYNILPVADLKQRVVQKKYEVHYNHRLHNGTLAKGTSEKKKDQLPLYVKRLNTLQNDADLEALAYEKACQLNYTGMRGSISTFLIPAVRPGDNALLSSGARGDNTQKYLVETVETTFGIDGARRKVELGPTFGFNKK